jgi:hypothetical protein
MLIIKPIKFTVCNTEGDFFWMIKREEYSNALFIFNDNIESKNSSTNGLGNACIREYSINGNLEVPKSAGIPTGSHIFRGFKSLTQKNKKYIDDSIDIIKTLIKSGAYSTIYYSCESFDSKLIGDSSFKIGEDVKEYITEEIWKLSSF